MNDLVFLMLRGQMVLWYNIKIDGDGVPLTSAWAQADDSC